MSNAVVRWDARLGRETYATDAKSLARALIGRVLVRTFDDGTRLAGVIVETEAYLGVKDAASHAYKGRRTARNEAMYARAGTAYVYFTYGMHFCLNVVCGDGPDHGVNQPHAVLIRALEPIEGLDRMQELRAAKRGAAGPRMPVTRLCSGPARLCQALAIDRGLNGADLVKGGELFICEAAAGVCASGKGGKQGKLGRGRKSVILRDARIGIAYSGEWAAKPLRFVLKDNPHVSVPPGRAR